MVNIEMPIHTSVPKADDFITKGAAPIAPAGTSNADLPDKMKRTRDVNTPEDNKSDWLIYRIPYDDGYDVEVWCISDNATHTSDHDYFAKLVYKDVDGDNKWDSGEDGGWIDVCPFEGGTNEQTPGYGDFENGSNYLTSMKRVVIDEKQGDPDDDGDYRIDEIENHFNASTMTVTITHTERDNETGIKLSEIKKEYEPFSDPSLIPPGDNTIDNSIKIELFEITTSSPLPSSPEDKPYATSGDTVLVVKIEKNAEDYSQNGSFTWEVTSGSLPPGLDLNNSTGVISGTPTESRENPWTFTVKITWKWIDGQGQKAITKEKQFAITITE
jgi:hypothetical protein